MKILFFLPLAIVAFVAIDQAALDSHYTGAALAQTDRHGGAISRDIRHWVSRNLTGR